MVKAGPDSDMASASLAGCGDTLPRSESFAGPGHSFVPSYGEPRPGAGGMGGSEPLIQHDRPARCPPFRAGRFRFLVIDEKTSWIVAVLSIIDAWRNPIAVNLIAPSGV